MIYFAAILFAAIPLSDNPWVHSAFIFSGTVFVAVWARDLVMVLGRNQKKIYQKLG